MIQDGVIGITDSGMPIVLPLSCKPGRGDCGGQKREAFIHIVIHMDKGSVIKRVALFPIREKGYVLVKIWAKQPKQL